MFYDRLKYITLAAFLAVGLAGVGIGRWVSASNGTGDESKLSTNGTDSRVALPQRPRAADKREPGDPAASPEDKDAAKDREARPGMTGRRREAVIRPPSGTFTKEVDAGPYGHGRLTP